MRTAWLYLAICDGTDVRSGRLCTIANTLALRGYRWYRRAVRTPLYQRYATPFLSFFYGRGYWRFTPIRLRIANTARFFSLPPLTPQINLLCCLYVRNYANMQIVQTAGSLMTRARHRFAPVQTSGLGVSVPAQKGETIMTYPLNIESPNRRQPQPQITPYSPKHPHPGTPIVPEIPTIPHHPLTPQPPFTPTKPSKTPNFPTPRRVKCNF